MHGGKWEYCTAASIVIRKSHNGFDIEWTGTCYVEIS